MLASSANAPKIAPVHDLLPSLAQVARELRMAAGLTYAHVAVHVRKRDGRSGVSESTVARFEYGQAWPENPDAMVAGYAHALDVEPASIWHAALVEAFPTVRHPRRRSRPTNGNGESTTAAGQTR
jgi:transcriptional regulator with XRE-family HTH domain